MASKSYSSEVRNEPNLAHNWSKNRHFSIFSDFLKNCPYHSNDFFYSDSTPYYGLLCATSLTSDGWDVRNIAKLNRRGPNINRFLTFLIFTKTSYDSNEISYNPSTLYYGLLCVISSSLYCCDVNNITKVNPKMAKKQSIFYFFWFLQKLSKRLERNFLQTFYAILESHMFNGIEIVWLWGEKWAEFSPKKVKKQSFFDFFRFSRKLSPPFERFFLRLFHAILWSFMCNFIKFGWLGWCEKHSPN